MKPAEIISVLTAFLTGNTIEYKSVNCDNWSTYNPTIRPLNFTNAYNGLETWRVKPQPVLIKRVALFQNTETGANKPVILSIDKSVNNSYDVVKFPISEGSTEFIFIKWLTDEFTYSTNSPNDVQYSPLHKNREIIIAWINDIPIQFRFTLFFSNESWIKFPIFYGSYVLNNNMEKIFEIFNYPYIEWKIVKDE